MKALSLLQPWASLVAEGAKKWETRSWRTKYRRTVAIHASGLSARAIRESYAIAEREPFKTALQPLVDPDELIGLSLPRGEIVAVADITEVITTTEWVRRHCSRTVTALTLGFEKEYAFGDYSPDRFAWKLENVRKLKTPVPCKGALSLWNVPPQIAAEVERNIV